MEQASEDRREGAADQEQAPALPTSVTLRGERGELRVRLVRPRSLGLRYEVTYSVATSQPRAYAAALGLCSSAIQKHVRWKGDVLGFGAGVLDWLLEEGVPYLDIIAAGEIAWIYVSDGLVSGREVDEKEGFTAPSEGGSTG